MGQARIGGIDKGSVHTVSHRRCGPSDGLGSGPFGLFAGITPEYPGVNPLFTTFGNKSGHLPKSSSCSFIMPGTNVLIADDDPFLREILEHKLRTAGYVVRMAEDGRRALVSCRSVRPDLVVLDAMMPIIDGFEVLRRLKADPETSALPVVMLTALRREEDIVGALKLGAADYIVKPFIPDELLARIGRLLPMRTDHADPSRSGPARLLRRG